MPKLKPLTAMSEKEKREFETIQAWSALSPEARLAAWKNNEQPRFRPMLSEIADVNKFMENYDEVSDVFNRSHPGASLIHIALAYVNPEFDRTLARSFNLDHRAILPCFGELMCQNPLGEYGRRHQPVVGFTVEYSKQLIENVHEVCGLEEVAKEQVEFFMSDKSPWWPLPKAVEIHDRLRSFPRIMLVNDTNQPAVALVNFLIAFRSLLFDRSNSRTYKALRNAGWSVEEAFFGNSILHASADGKAFALEHRQVEFPITGEKVARSRGSYRAFIEQNPKLTGDMAFWKSSGIPNNIMWELARNRKNKDIFSVFPDKFKEPYNAWAGTRITIDELPKVREFIQNS